MRILLYSVVYSDSDSVWKMWSNIHVNSTTQHSINRKRLTLWYFGKYVRSLPNKIPTLWKSETKSSTFEIFIMKCLIHELFYFLSLAFAYVVNGWLNVSIRWLATVGYPSDLNLFRQAISINISFRDFPSHTCDYDLPVPHLYRNQLDHSLVRYKYGALEHDRL